MGEALARSSLYAHILHLSLCARLRVPVWISCPYNGLRLATSTNRLIIAVTITRTCVAQDFKRAVLGAQNKSIIVDLFHFVVQQVYCVCNNPLEHVLVCLCTYPLHTCVCVRVFLRTCTAIIFASELFSCAMHHPPPSVPMSGPITAPIAHRDD